MTGLLDAWWEWRQSNAEALGAAGKAGIAATRKALRGETLTDDEQAAIVNSPAASFGAADLQAPGLLLAGTYAGIRSATANKAALKTAKEMEKAGESAKPDGRIRRETGWFKEPGGDWQYEISDYNASVRKHPTEPDQFVIDHPELYEAYPQLKDMPVHRLRDDATMRGWYDEGQIGLRDLEGDEVHSTALHELNHAVQDIEGFPAGAMPYKADEQAFAAMVRRGSELDRKEAFDGLTDAERQEIESLINQITAIRLATKNSMHDYRRTLGEFSSRDVQARADYTPEQRQAIPPYSSEDIPEYIIRRYPPRGKDGWRGGLLPTGRDDDTTPGLLPYGLTETVKRRAARGLLER